MVMTFQGFSIREYAANMRRVNLDKCWPFDYGGGGGGATKSLPQITVKRFRFWWDEIKSEEENEKMDEIKSGFSSKGKQKNQKKRSIVELFAVAPQMDGDEMKAKKKTLMKKEKRKIKDQICAAKKGKTSKPASSSHILHKLRGSVHKKLTGKKIRNPTDRGNKPLYIKNLAKNRKLKLFQSSKLKSKKQRERGKVLQAHNILKNPRSTVKKAGAKTITQGGEDDILGHVNSCSHIDIPQLRSLCKIFSDVLAASSAFGNTQKVDNLPAAANMTQAENASDKNVTRNAVETRDGISSKKEPLSLAHSELVANKSCSDTERTSASISMDQNQPMQSYNDADRFIPWTSTTLADDRCLDDPRIQGSIQSEGLSSHSDTLVKETSLKASDSQSLTTIGRCLSRSSATGSPSFIRNPQPPIDSCWKITELHPMHHCLSRDLMESKRAFAPAYKDKCIDLSFVGLPLNSQGELIGLQSGANLGFGEISKSQNDMQGSIHSYAAPNYCESRTNGDHLKISHVKFPGTTLNRKDMSNLSQEQYFHVSKPAEYENGFNNLRSFERFGVQSNETPTDKDQILRHDPYKRGVSYHGIREDNRTQNYIDRVNFQPEGNMEHVFPSNIQQTMRLMGTNVTIGRMNKGCQRYDDGRIWTDKEVVNDPPHWMKQQWVAHQSSSSPKNNLCHPLDATSNSCHIPAITPRLGISHFDYRPQWISRNCTSTSSRNNCFQVDFFSHPLNFKPLMNETSNSTMTSIPMGHQIPMLASNPPRSYQHMLLNSTQCKHSSGIVCGAQPGFRPPFLYQETGSSIQPSPAQSSPNLPHWLLNANMQKKNQEYSCSCNTNQVTTYHQCGLVPTNFFPLPCPNHTSTISFPVYTAPITSQRNVMDNNSRNEKLNREGTNFNFTYLKSLDTSVKTRKRPAATDDEFMKPAKKPFLRLQDDTSASAGIGHTPDSMKTTNLNNPEIVNEKGSSKNLSPSSSLKVDGESRYGPIKLSAGAKHVLKPSQVTDQDNSRPIHSTIPFSVANISGKAVKGAAIYRF